VSQYILALDQGTTSSRALVVAADGSVVASAQREIAQHYPRPGWVEHDAEEIWATQLATATEAMARAGVAPDQPGSAARAEATATSTSAGVARARSATTAPVAGLTT
jgi:glycerol kinase